MSDRRWPKKIHKVPRRRLGEFYQRSACGLNVPWYAYRDLGLRGRCRRCFGDRS
jgi:hypothetical protein